MKNILFVSTTCDYSEIKDWFKENPMYKEVRVLPQLTEKKEQYSIVSNYRYIDGKWEDVLKLLNDENSICVLIYFGENTYHSIDKIFDTIKNRKYTNVSPNGDTQENNLENLKLVIAISSYMGGFSLDPKYYEFFDEVYLMGI